MSIFESLCKTNTASGAESDAVNMINEYFKEKGAFTQTDALGNLSVKLTDAGEGAEKIAVFVAVDAPGLIVTYIENDGKIKVSSLGKCDYKSAVFNTVTNSKITGILLPNNGESDSVDKSYVSFGFKDRTEAQAEISEGDILFFNDSVTELKNGIFCGAGIGAKAVCAAVCLAAEKLSDTHTKTVYLVFCTQSEIMGRGAYSAAFGIMPDKALCISPYNGKNFAVKVLDKSLVCDRALTEQLYTVCSKYASNTERYISATEMSDAAKVQSAGYGTKVASVMFPAENVNTLAETITTDNIKVLSDITAEFLRNI